jgi:predicted membrane protein
MSHRNSKQERGVRMYKTLAQTVGVVACLFFLLFIIGEGIPDIVKGDGGGLLSFLPFILVPIAGFILTWFKEWPGVLLLTAGGVALMVYFFIKGDTAMALVYGLPFIVTGLLFLLHLKKRNELQHQHHQHK